MLQFASMLLPRSVLLVYYLLTEWVWWLVFGLSLTAWLATPLSRILWRSLGDGIRARRIAQKRRVG